jgi:adenylosuccinate synthase
MPVDVLLGLQWGDEGKGKVVDYLAPRYQLIARFQGGPNAGHTLEFNGIKHVLHQIPSGIFHEDIKNVIGNGVVLDPIVFKKEIEGLSKYGLSFRNLYISKKAQLIVPTHRILDLVYEKAMGDKKIGSTLKGIGPCYQDKIGRHGLRIGDLTQADFRQKYSSLIERHKKLLGHFNHEVDFEALNLEFFEAVELLKTFNLVDSEYFINQAIAEGQSILAEGAQGSMLDIDFGSYPYVTSSSTMVAGACTGLGVAPKHIREVFGILKAYSTRVGSGPFLTELNDPIGEYIRTQGHEFGSTTGRPRRTGWLDLPALKYASMISGITQLFLMKVDVLDDLDEIKVCTGYLSNGEVASTPPSETNLSDLEPDYVHFPGWKCSTRQLKSFDALPSALSKYISFIEQNMGVNIHMVSTGPDRLHTLIKDC